MPGTDTVAVSRGDLRLLVLAAGLVVADYDAIPDDGDERSDEQDERLDQFEDAGLLTFGGTDDDPTISMDPLKLAVARVGNLVIDEPAPDYVAPAMAGPDASGHPEAP